MRPKKKARYASTNWVTELECEHCGHVVAGEWVSEPLFYKFLPKERCPECGKTGQVTA